MLKRSHVILTLVLAAATAGCNTAGCLDNQSALPQAELRSSTTGDKITLSNLLISGVGAPGDSALIRPGTAVQTFYLPMRSTMHTTAWCFHYEQEGISNPAFNDTIEFTYESRPFFASEECGAMYNYLITEVRNTFHLLDSVVVTDSLITNVDMTRILLYFRTADTPENPDDPETPENPDEPENPENPENPDGPQEQ